MSAAMGGGRRRQAGVLAERYMPESWAGNGRGLPQHDRPHASPRNALGAPSKTAWKAACACGRLSLKVGVIIEFSTEKGSGCRWIAATCPSRITGQRTAGERQGLGRVGRFQGVAIINNAACPPPNRLPAPRPLGSHLLKALEPRRPPLLLHALQDRRVDLQQGRSGAGGAGQANQQMAPTGSAGRGARPPRSCWSMHRNVPTSHPTTRQCNTPTQPPTDLRVLAELGEVAGQAPLLGPGQQLLGVGDHHRHQLHAGTYQAPITGVSRRNLTPQSHAASRGSHPPPAGISVRKPTRWHPIPTPPATTHLRPQRVAVHKRLHDKG